MILHTKDAILNKDDKVIQKIFVKPWNSEVYIRVMSSRERDAFEMSVIPSDGTTQMKLNNFRARLAACCLCDEQGNNLFTEKDALELGKKSSIALNIIATAVKSLNGISAEVERDILKNLGGVQD